MTCLDIVAGGSCGICPQLPRHDAVYNLHKRPYFQAGPAFPLMANMGKVGNPSCCQEDHSPPPWLL